MGNKEQVYIFGAGLAGKAALAHLDDKEVLGFFDNNQSKVGTFLCGKPIKCPSSIPSLNFDYIYIASEFFEQIQYQLLNEYHVCANKTRVMSASEIKPFYFGVSTEARDISEQILGLLCQMLKQINATFYVDAGTLLGVYRDNALIPWDDDLDFALLSSSLDIVCQELVNILNALQQLTGVEWSAKEHFSACNFRTVKKGTIRSIKLRPTGNNVYLPSIDLFVKYVSGDLMDYVLASRGISMPSQYIYNTKTFDFKGYGLIIPKDPERYLEEHYGSGWRVPIKKWNLSMLSNSVLF
ncbi:LicD family protein [Catenovulum adriaticum]|uniref:LicD family protein n=1 Tax=Catenovulum adriaticum TaxID=2984846 RepID=A0ABY7API2_9ALTE|nr:LicD family protein [Catenovulum sp. TS8]WAJ71046.1 LicD family protein [Catenovulum sp. TS8]